jgi:HK97 family phage prohead protease
VADTKKPYGDVTYADPKNGKYPIDTEEHARAAWSYINQAKNAAMYPMNGVTLSEVKGRIVAACKKFGIDVSDSDSDDSGTSGRADSLVPYCRSFPLEDISVRAGGDGRTVEAYAAVFNSPAPVHDQDGEYTEELDPSCFSRAIANAAPQGNRRNWKIGVFYNHGRTISGAPSDRHSMPVGKIVDIKADQRGLWTEVRYNRTQLADEVLENIREGSISGYSFQGQFRRSAPLIPRGGFRKNYRTGEVPHVRRLESTLLELGPTPMPVYEGAAVTAMRADQLLGAMAADPELAMRMISMFSASTHDGDPLPDTGTPPHGDSPAEDSHPMLVHSGRSLKQEMQTQRSAFLQRYRR